MIMRKAMRTLLWTQNRKTSVFLSSLVLLIGFSILVLSFGVYRTIQQTVSNDEELFSPDFVVINKKVSLLNTINIAKSGFSETEISDLKKQKFVQAIAPFMSNQFKIGAYTDATEELPGFYTELFFQSIPDKYLNIKDKKWKWEIGQTEIPIIFPGDYLKLYNFGFATSQGLPQVSAETIGRVSLKVKIQGKNGPELYSARIIGLTDKVNSILVPQSFMIWANKNFSQDSAIQNPSMILIEIANASDPGLFDYLQKHHYETNKERIKNSKTTVFLKILFSVVGLIGFIIISLSLIMFALSLEILILRSSKELKKLFLIGYHPKNLLPWYLKLVFIILLIINLLSLLISYISIELFQSILAESGFKMQSSEMILIVIFSALLSFIVFIINMITINFQLRRINGEK